MDYDVAVIGSGPAGMSAAMNLAGKGLSVLVVERLGSEAFDRYHSTCGEAVSDRMFNKLGWKTSAVVTRVDTLSISFSDARIDIPVKGSIVDRPRMLDEMRSLCDAEFIRASVASVSEDGNQYNITFDDDTSVSCHYLIGADGAHSIVRKCIFGTGPEEYIPVINCVADGDEDSLHFVVEEGYSGSYSWRFPSKPGTISTGFPTGLGDPKSIPGLRYWGARHIPIGMPETVVKGNCMLVGDAACMPNPLSYGGIGLALVSGRYAADSIVGGDLGTYRKWTETSPLLNHHFMKAHDQFVQWDNDDIRDAMVPFHNGYSLLRGLYAVLRRPKWANVYVTLYIAFKLGW